MKSYSDSAADCQPPDLAVPITPSSRAAAADGAADGGLAPLLVGVAERVVRGVDDDLRVVVHVRPAVGADQTAGAVVLRRPRPQVKPRRRHSPRHDADPRLVAQDRTVLADE